jgi:hypothetical protein
VRTRKIIQRVSVGLVLGAEAVGAILIHESHSLAITAPVVIAVIMATVWLLDSGLDWGVKKWDWAANLIGVRPASKVRINGYWYSAIRDHDGALLGGSLFQVKAGIDSVDFIGLYKDLTVAEDDNPWTWWSGEGSPYGDDAILYEYKGEEDGSEDEGYGKYLFPRGASPEPVVWGSFYGKNLPENERDRVVRGERVPQREVTPDFLKDPEVKKHALERYLVRQPTHTTPASSSVAR